MNDQPPVGPENNDKPVIDLGVSFVYAEMDNMGIPRSRISEVNVRYIAADLADLLHDRIHNYCSDSSFSQRNDP